MAAVSLDTAELETLVESALRNKRSGMALLNVLRVANGKAAHPNSYGSGELNHIEDGAWRSALAGVEAALEA